MECVLRLGWKANPRSPWKLPFLGPTVIKVLVDGCLAAGPSNLINIKKATHSKKTTGCLGLPVVM